MRVLVLGGSGFLGSHIVDKFLREKHDVTVYDLYPERFRRSPAKIKFVTGDFGNVGALDELISTGFDAVIHCVSTTTPKSSNESPEFDIQSNVIGTLYLLDICAKRNVGKLVFLSSGGTVYGDIGGLDVVDETHAVRPMCSYGVSKLSIEHYLDVYKHLRGLNYVALRLSNPYGERQSPLRALGALTVFLHRTLRRQDVEVWGDGSVTPRFYLRRRCRKRRVPRDGQSHIGHLQCRYGNGAFLARYLDPHIRRGRHRTLGHLACVEILRCSQNSIGRDKAEEGHSMESHHVAGRRYRHHGQMAAASRYLVRRMPALGPVNTM